MVMRAMREYSKYVFWILAISFIGWLAYGQVLDILRPGGNAVLTVNGRPVSQPEFQARVQQAYDQYRRQNGTTPRTRNLIAGAQVGVDIQGQNSSGNVVQGNFLGTDATGTFALPNGDGVVCTLHGDVWLVSGIDDALQQRLVGDPDLAC